MIKKTISGICAVLLALTTVSCQKSNVDQALDTQTDLIETMQKINDQESADKYADEVAEILSNFSRLEKLMDKTQEEDTLKDSKKYEENWKQLEALGNKLHTEKYYNSEKLRNALRIRY